MPQPAKSSPMQHHRSALCRKGHVFVLRDSSDVRMDLLVVPPRNGSTTQIVVTDVRLSVGRSDVLTRKVAGGAYGRPTGTGHLCASRGPQRASALRPQVRRLRPRTSLPESSTSSPSGVRYTPLAQRPVHRRSRHGTTESFAYERPHPPHNGHKSQHRRRRPLAAIAVLIPPSGRITKGRPSVVVRVVRTTHSPVARLP
jgi:hypothetical protein